MQKNVKIAVRKNNFQDQPRKHFSLLIYNSVQANPVIGCVISDRPYRSFYILLCCLWCPTKNIGGVTWDTVL